jgi:4a-hydroxytetrahydrobiopterin dehydratase
MIDLTKKHCKSCEGGVEAVSADAARELLQGLEGWTIEAGGGEIRKAFDFGNYYETMAFVNAVAWISHREDHHPDLEVSYKRCVVRYSTHAIHGLSENDFICAAKVSALRS